jgi:hypothetical protein
MALSAEERQARRDEVEKWRVATLNWALSRTEALPLHGLPHCLKTVGSMGVTFQEHSVTDWGAMTIQRGMSNFDRLKELLFSVGFMEQYARWERDDRAEQYAKTWSSSNHDDFIHFVVNGKHRNHGVEAAVSAAAGLEADGWWRSGDNVLDDGIGLDEVLANEVGSAGSW